MIFRSESRPADGLAEVFGADAENIFPNQDFCVILSYRESDLKPENEQI